MEKNLKEKKSKLEDYLNQYFSNVYVRLKSNKYNINELLDIVIEHFKIKLIELDKKFGLCRRVYMVRKIV